MYIYYNITVISRKQEKNQWNREDSPSQVLVNIVRMHVPKERHTKEERRQSKSIQRAQKPLKLSALARWVSWELRPDFQPHCTSIGMTSAGRTRISSKLAP